MPFRLVGVSKPERDPFTPGRTRVPQPEQFVMGRRKKLANAYRKAVQEILADGPPEVRIYQGDQMVGKCELRNKKIRGGNKFYVQCSGDKAPKLKR